MEIILFTIATISIFFISLCRFRKAKKIVLNDAPNPANYITPEYVNAFSSALRKKGIQLENFKY